MYWIAIVVVPIEFTAAMKIVRLSEDEQLVLGGISPSTHLPTHWRTRELDTNLEKSHSYYNVRDITVR